MNIYKIYFIFTIYFVHLFLYLYIYYILENEENNNNNINNSINNSEDDNNNNLPTYEESVNIQPFVNDTSPIMNPNFYFPYNPSYIVPPIVTNTQYTTIPTTQLPMESFQYAFIPPSPYDISLNLQPTAPQEISSNQPEKLSHKQ